MIVQFKCKILLLKLVPNVSISRHFNIQSYQSLMLQCRCLITLLTQPTSHLN